MYLFFAFRMVTACKWVQRYMIYDKVIWVNANTALFSLGFPRYNIGLPHRLWNFGIFLLHSHQITLG